MENGSQKPPISSLCGDRFSIIFATFSEGRLFDASFTLRACPPTHLHAAQFLRSAAYSQRNFLAAQFLLFLANRGGPQGWDPWDPKEGPPWGPWAPLLRTEGPLRGPWAQGGPFGPAGGGRLRRPWAHGGRWDDFEAAPNGMFFRWRFDR